MIMRSIGTLDKEWKWKLIILRINLHSINRIVNERNEIVLIISKPPTNTVSANNTQHTITKHQIQRMEEAEERATHTSIKPTHIHQTSTPTHSAIKFMEIQLPEMTSQLSITRILLPMVVIITLLFTSST